MPRDSAAVGSSLTLPMQCMMLMSRVCSAFRDDDDEGIASQRQVGNFRLCAPTCRSRGSRGRLSRIAANAVLRQKIQNLL